MACPTIQSIQKLLRFDQNLSYELGIDLSSMHNNGSVIILAKKKQLPL